AARRDVRVVADRGRDVVDVDYRRDGQAEGGGAGRDAHATGDGKDVRVLLGLHDDVAVGVDGRAVADRGMRVVVAHQDDDRAADGAVARADDIGADRELVLRRRRLDHDVAA